MHAYTEEAMNNAIEDVRRGTLLLLKDILFHELPYSTKQKRALFWPDVKEKTGKRPKKEKLPSVATSKQWQEHHSKKTQIRKENEERKQERARENQLKKENMETRKEPEKIN
ncbi:hypothetical protein QE152_g6117 [Popillia japonica]|uniref:Uncharacterized protein n=1 Tax=Popillia japonica TaxID=7064 RepID=A0AAW1MK76_POPJA